MIAAEQKARVTYDNLLRLIDDPDVRDPLKFLREREIVHYQRFAESLMRAQEIAPKPNFYACNPSFDQNCTDVDERAIPNCGCGNIGAVRNVRQSGRSRCDRCGR